MVFVFAVAMCAAFAATDTHPVVGPGATREDVIKAYGWPNGQSQSGTKEILSYAQGEVVLENGRVERVNFSPDVPWQAPRPRPGAPTASTRKVVEVPPDFWLTSFPDALREAQRRPARILALFTGSDWSPASREFHDQVEYNPDFVNAFAGDFVFVKLDYPRGSPVPAKISPENLALRDRYGVTVYPTLLVLSSTGDLLARVDLTKPEGGAFRDRVIAGLHEARDATAGVPLVRNEPPPAEPSSTPSPKSGGSPTAASDRRQSVMIGAPESVAAIWTAGNLVFVALLIGAVAVIAVWWWMWRQRQSNRQIPVLEMTERIDAAAGGMPGPAEMSAWSKNKLRAVVAGLAEFDNFSVQVRPPGDDADLELRKHGDVKPRVFVTCAAGSDGIVSAKRLRELFGTLAAEGVDQGWFVSPVGFTAEAKAYAAAHRIVLVGSEGLHTMMRDVPPVSLPALLARE
jgi:hypothetical protein